MISPILTPQEVCQRLGLTPCQLNYQRKMKNIGYLKLGREVRYTEKHITDFLERCEVPCEASRPSINIPMAEAPTGLLNIMTDSERAAALRGALLARKTLKQTNSLPPSRSPEINPSHSQQRN